MPVTWAGHLVKLRLEREEGRFSACLPASSKMFFGPNIRFSIEKIQGREYGVTQKCAAEARRKTARRENQALGGLVKTFRVPMVPGVAPPFRFHGPYYCFSTDRRFASTVQKNLKSKMIRAKRQHIETHEEREKEEGRKTKNEK